MSSARAIAIGLLLAATWPQAPASARGAGSLPQVRVSVAVCDSVHVPPAFLAGAKHIAGSVYRDIGVTIDWRDGRCGDDQLAVRLIWRRDTAVDVSGETVGFAEPGTSVAMVLYDRVDLFARRYHVKSEVLLGYAMAHELGHLLLPPNSHSVTGVMRATLNLDQAAAKRLGFTKEQGKLIVGTLGGSPS